MVPYCCECLFWSAHRISDSVQVNATNASQGHCPHQGNSLYTAYIQRSVMAPCMLTDAAAPVEALDHENATWAMISSIEGDKQVQ